MGKYRHEPKYNIISTRVSDELIEKFDELCKKVKMTRSALLSKMLSDAFKGAEE